MATSTSETAVPPTATMSGSVIEATVIEQNLMEVVAKSEQENDNDNDEEEEESSSLSTATNEMNPREVVFQVGSRMKTKYGIGKIVHYRPHDKMYTLDLGQGISLFTTSLSEDNCLDTATNNNASLTPTSTTKTTRTAIEDTTTQQTQTTSTVTTTTSSKKKKNKHKNTMELNVAYEAVEKMRRLNLEMECFEKGVIVNHDKCTTCLLTGQTTTRFPRLQKLMDSRHSIEHNSIHHTDTQKEPPAQETCSVAATASTTKDVTTTNNSSRNGLLVPDILNRAATNTKKATEDAAALMTSTKKLAVDRWNSSSSTDTTNTDTTAGTSDSGARFPRLHKFMDTTTKSVSSAASLRPNIKLFGSTTVTTNSSGSSHTQTSHQGQANSTTSNNTTTTNTNSTLRFPRIQKLMDGATATAGATSAKISERITTTTTTTSTTTAATVQAPNAASTDNSDKSTTITNNPPPSTTDHPPQKLKNHPNNPKPVVLPRIQKLIDSAQNVKTSPCLICASPSCTAHSSASFRKNNITLCLDCEKLFELDFIVDCCASENEHRAQHVDHMVDLYDRSLLLLKYSSQFIPQIADQLETSTERQNSVKLGSSGVGVVSGVLGVAAAATILTPAGPPLLIASLLFGGGATAVQTSTEAVNYFSEPNQLADRIIALHGMLLSILRVTSTLRDAMMVNHIRTDAFLDDQDNNNNDHKLPHVSKAGVMASANVGRSITLGGAVAAAETTAVSTVAAETGVLAGSRATASLTRAGTAAARTLRFARFAGGALSAAVLVMEANAIQQTLKQMQNGNPCEKADNLRKIYEEIKDLPSTDSLDRECQRYLKTLAERPEPAFVDMSSSKVLEDDDGIPVAVGTPIGDDIVTETKKEEALVTVTNDNSNLCPPGATIIDGEDDVQTQTVATAQVQQQSNATTSSTLGSSSRRLGGSSLLERIQRRRAREVMEASASRDDGAEDFARIDDDEKDDHDLSLNLVV